ARATGRVGGRRAFALRRHGPDRRRADVGEADRLRVDPPECGGGAGPTAGRTSGSLSAAACTTHRGPVARCRVGPAWGVVGAGRRAAPLSGAVGGRMAPFSLSRSSGSSPQQGRHRRADAHSTTVMSGLPFSTTQVASSAALPPPAFLPAWTTPAGTVKASPALNVLGGWPSI